MNTSRSFSLAKLLLLLGLLAVGGSVVPAHAQTISDGKFTLPFEARWGDVHLPAGNYVYSVQNAGPATFVVVHGETGKGAAAMFVARMSEQADYSDHSQLIFLRSDKGLIVRSLSLGKLGLVLDFNLPKAETEIRARGPEPPQTVSVAKASD
jgi:hypothetical protein